MEQMNAEVLEFVEKSEHNLQQNSQYLPLNINFSEERKVGRQFHLLIQQLMMGLPVEPFLEAYPEMAHWVKQLYPIISVPAQKQCNVNKGKLIGEWYLVAHYDLLIKMQEKVIAVVWTNKIHIPQPENLENSWLTQLGLFILAETQELPAENISIIYCFVNGDDYLTTYQFNYNQEKHEAFIERLAMTLSKLPTTRNSHDSNLSVEDEMNEHLLNLQKLFRGEINTTEYLTTIPEVEI